MTFVRYEVRPTAVTFVTDGCGDCADYVKVSINDPQNLLAVLQAYGDSLREEAAGVGKLMEYINATGRLPVGSEV